MTIAFHARRQPPAALDLIATPQSEHGPVLFHQSGGCCDGSSPMCYPQGDFIVGDEDVHCSAISAERRSI